MVTVLETQNVSEFFHRRIYKSNRVTLMSMGECIFSANMKCMLYFSVSKQEFLFKMNAAAFRAFDLLANLTFSVFSVWYRNKNIIRWCFTYVHYSSTYRLYLHTTHRFVCLLVFLVACAKLHNKNIQIFCVGCFDFLIFPWW